MTHNYTNKAKVGDVILPYQGRDRDGNRFKPSVFGKLKTQDEGLEFVVERTAMEGGGYGHGLHDVYPDGWHVTARKLHEDGTYDPKGKTIDFYQSGAFIDLIAEVPVIRKMRMTFEVTR